MNGPLDKDMNSVQLHLIYTICRLLILKIYRSLFRGSADCEPSAMTLASLDLINNQK